MNARMPTSGVDPAAHLSPVALSMLRALLLCELVAQLAQAEAYRAAAARLANQAERDLVESELVDAAADRADETIACIRQAIDRLDRGTYGRCHTCLVEIPLERLEEMPHTLLCARCSQRARGPLSIAVS